jgi:DNA-binding MarR family transcriptional regulator
MAGTDTGLAQRAWRVMSDLVVDHDRKVAVSRALDLSWARVRALQQLAAQPHTLRSLARSLAADPPYATLIVDGLEERGLARRVAHPDDRRAKLVELTRAGRALLARAEAMLDEPPPALLNLSDAELEALLLTLERIRRDVPQGR